ncbi:MAG: phosphoribosylglycinamide formyltransferase [Arcanobacterium sp.]|nr:phosphoribosylglycinamide formyltransferase [Arcanobacterium sp.]MDY5589686.1 phosphoribosylglycinamide formyltransferase [Arcanobacterium sp.]
MSEKPFPSALGINSGPSFHDTLDALSALQKRINMAVFASGTGSNFRALCDAARAGTLGAAEPMLLICNRECNAMDIAREKEIPAYVFSPQTFNSRQEWEEKIVSVVHAFEIDFIALAGYTKKVGAPLLTAFPEKIVNLHPSLLPAYSGLHAIERIWNDAHSSDPAVRTAARTAAGVTVHIADEHLDHGPILAQRSVPVETFANQADFEAAVHTAEHLLFPSTVAEFAATLERQQESGTPDWLQQARKHQHQQ